MIEVKKSEKSENPLRIQEVQDAMKVNDYLGNNKEKWMNGELLNAVAYCFTCFAVSRCQFSKDYDHTERSDSP